MKHEKGGETRMNGIAPFQKKIGGGRQSFLLTWYRDQGNYRGEGARV